MSKLRSRILRDVARYRLVCRATIILAVFSSSVPAASQQKPLGTPNAPDRILVRLRPTGSDEKDKKALDLLMQLFESEEIRVDSGVKVADLARQRCGRVDKNWIKALLRKNPSVTRSTITKAMTLIAPPCPFWRRAGRVKVPKGGTLSHQLLLQMGTLGGKTLDAVAKQNGRSPASLDSVEPKDEVQLPYVTSFSPYVLKTAYRADLKRATSALKEVPGYLTSVPQRGFSLITAASDSDCIARADDEEWPFSAKRLRDVLEYNNTKRSLALRKAVIAVADTGLDENDDRVFLDSIVGANMDSNRPGFPASDHDYKDSSHGTHVAGLALGGLKDAELEKLVKERIAIRVINMVRREVIQGTDERITQFSIPNDYLLKALQYAGREPAVQIINLSVEDEEVAGLDEVLRANLSLIVAAAGNDGIDIDENERYPAAVRARDRLIAVAAHDASGSLAGFSNWGMGNVDLAAPGCQIDSILPAGSRGRINGTSQAAPLVSFTAALLYSEGLAIAQIKDRILLTTEMDRARLGDCTGEAGRCVATEGRLNIISALQVYQDLVVRQNPDGSQVAVWGRIKDPCIGLDGRCYDVRTALKRVVHDPGSKKGRVWIKSKGDHIMPRPCVIDAPSINFQQTGAQQIEPIPMSEVLDLVPAEFEEATSTSLHPRKGI